MNSLIFSRARWTKAQASRDPAIDCAPGFDGGEKRKKFGALASALDISLDVFAYFVKGILCPKHVVFFGLYLFMS